MLKKFGMMATALILLSSTTNADTIKEYREATPPAGAIKMEEIPPLVNSYQSFIDSTQTDSAAKTAKGPIQAITPMPVQMEQIQRSTTQSLADDTANIIR